MVGCLRVWLFYSDALPPAGRLLLLLLQARMHGVKQARIQRASMQAVGFKLIRSFYGLDPSLHLTSLALYSVALKKYIFSSFETGALELLGGRGGCKLGAVQCLIFLTTPFNLLCSSSLLQSRAFCFFAILFLVSAPPYSCCCGLSVDFQGEGRLVRGAVQSMPHPFNDAFLTFLSALSPFLLLLFPCVCFSLINHVLWPFKRLSSQSCPKFWTDALQEKKNWQEPKT